MRNPPYPPPVQRRSTILVCGLLLLGVLAAGLSAVGSRAQEARPRAPESPEVSVSMVTATVEALRESAAGDVLGTINLMRAEAGIRPLRFDLRLVRAAERLSAVMAEQGTMDPEDVALDELLEDFGYYFDDLWSTAVSYTGTEGGLGDIWTRRDYREFLLDPSFTSVGIGVEASESGRKYLSLIVATEDLLSAPGAELANAGPGTQRGQAEAILELVNVVRDDAGLPLLALDSRLNEAARAHSRYMAETGILAHVGAGGSTPAERVAAQGYDWAAVGENILDRSNVHAAGAFDQWWNSPPHRENLLNPRFTEVGIGFARGDDGTVYYTMELARPRGD